MGFNKLLNLGLPVSDKNTDKLNILVLKRALYFFGRSLLPALWSVRGDKFQNCHLSL
jgi:hypothetical protein